MIFFDLQTLLFFFFVFAVKSNDKSELLQMIDKEISMAREESVLLKIDDG